MARRARAFEHDFVVLAFEIVAPGDDPGVQGRWRWEFSARIPWVPKLADLILGISEIWLVYAGDCEHRHIRQIILLDARKHCDWIARRICIGAMTSNRRHVLPLCLSSRKTPTAPKHSPNTVGQQ